MIDLIRSLVLLLSLLETSRKATQTEYFAGDTSILRNGIDSASDDQYVGCSTLLSSLH